MTLGKVVPSKLPWANLQFTTLVNEKGKPYSSPAKICSAIQRGVPIINEHGEEFIRAKEACAALGISRQTLRKGTRIGKIPHRRIGWLTGYERVLIPMSYINYINTNPKKDRAGKRTEMAGVLL